MVPPDQSAGHALARAKRLLSGGHCSGPAVAATHQAVAAYTSLTTPGAAVSCCSSISLPLLGSVVGGGVGK